MEKERGRERTHTEKRRAGATRAVPRGKRDKGPGRRNGSGGPRGRRGEGASKRAKLNVHVWITRPGRASVSPRKRSVEPIHSSESFQRETRGTRWKGVKERRGRQSGRGERTIGEGQRLVPGACTIASPWRNNGFWMSHRVQSQTAVSHRGISQRNDRFAVAPSRPSIYGRPPSVRPSSADRPDDRDPGSSARRSAS